MSVVLYGMQEASPLDSTVQRGDAPLLSLKATGDKVTGNLGVHVIATSVDVDGGIPFFGPGMYGAMRFGEQQHATNSGGRKIVKPTGYYGRVGLLNSESQRVFDEVAIGQRLFAAAA